MAQNAPDTNKWRGAIINTAGVEGTRGIQGQVAIAAASAAIIGMIQYIYCDDAEGAIFLFGLKFWLNLQR